MAEACEIVGIFLSLKMGHEFDKEYIGFYRDDGFLYRHSRSCNQGTSYYFLTFIILTISLSFIDNKKRFR